jgi:hypothetical protein
MATITIRNGSPEEVQHFALWSDANEGATIEVAEDESGAIVGFIQRDGAYIRFLESDKPGVGRAMVDYLKTEMGDWLQACNVSSRCSGFWTKMGFEKGRRSADSAGDFDYEWYSDDA